MAISWQGQSYSSQSGCLAVLSNKIGQTSVTITTWLLVPERSACLCLPRVSDPIQKPHFEGNLLCFYWYEIQTHCDGPDVCFVLALVAGSSCILSARQTLVSVSASITTYQLSLFNSLAISECMPLHHRPNTLRHKSILPDCCIRDPGFTPDFALWCHFWVMAFGSKLSKQRCCLHGCLATFLQQKISLLSGKAALLSLASSCVNHKVSAHYRICVLQEQTSDAF